MPKDAVTLAQVSHIDCRFFAAPRAARGLKFKFPSCSAFFFLFFLFTSLPGSMAPWWSAFAHVAHHRLRLPGMPQDGNFRRQSSHFGLIFLLVVAPLGLQPAHQCLLPSAMLNEASVTPQSSHFG
jgi:hypothetical protein